MLKFGHQRQFCKDNGFSRSNNFAVYHSTIIIILQIEIA